MEMGKPTEQHRKLEAMVGEWNGEEKMHASPWDPKGGNATSVTRARLEIDGFFVITDYVQKRGAQVSYRGHGVIGWDARLQHYTMHWFDSMGCDPGPAALGTMDGKTLQFLQQHHMGHNRITYGFDSKDRYTFKLEQSQDGKSWTPFIDGVYKRVS